MKELRRIRDHVPKLFAPKEITERLPDDEYSRFSYPKTIKLMDFDVRRYRVQGFGNVMTMLTGTPFGMELLTCSFMPNEGNPSSAVLKKVFGEAGAERFFRICVMPLRGEMS